MSQRKNLRIGVFGVRRGSTYVKAILDSGLGARVTALCDGNEERLREVAELCPKGRFAPKLFTDAEEFLASKAFDAVILCNYFNEHAEYAVKALEKGIHVLSETMAAATLSDAVRLCRAAEESRGIYMLAENYCFNKGNTELRRLYRGGTLGKLIFAEGEYVHMMGPKETATYCDPAKVGEHHWRRYMPVTYYSSHSLGPLIYITGQMPKRVVTMTAQDPPEHFEGNWRIHGDAAGIMLITTADGAVMRVNGSSYMAPRGNWYRIACTKGGAETVRGDYSKVRVSYNSWEVPEGAQENSIYEAEWESDTEAACKTGHGGADYWTLRYFIEACRGIRAPFPDVYTAAAMSAVAILGWRSAQNGNIPYDIPDFRDKEAVRLLEDDRLSPFWPNNI